MISKNYFRNRGECIFVVFDSQNLELYKVLIKEKFGEAENSKEYFLYFCIIYIILVSDIFEQF